MKRISMLGSLKRCTATTSNSHEVSLSCRRVLGASVGGARFNGPVNPTFSTHAALGNHYPITNASPHLLIHNCGTNNNNTLSNSTSVIIYTSPFNSSSSSRQQRYLTQVQIKEQTSTITEEDSPASSPTIKTPITTTTTTTITNPNDNRPRPPSLLSQTYNLNTSTPTQFTSGQAWHILSTNAAGGKQVRHQDVGLLCSVSKPNSRKDAKVIRTALCDLKRCNRFVLSLETAEVAMEGMFRSLGPPPPSSPATTTDDDDDDNVEVKETKLQMTPLEAGIWLGETFVNRDTGLYICVDTSLLEKMVLEPLVTCLSSDEPPAAVTTSSNDDDDDTNSDIDDNKAETEEEEASLQTKAANVTKEIIQTLIYRSSGPTQTMKKRAKRKYLRYRQVSQGPTPQTVHLAVQVCLEAAVASSSCEDRDVCIQAARTIVDEYKDKEFLGIVMTETMALLEAAEMESQVVEEKEEEEQSEEGESSEESDEGDKEEK